MDKKWLSEVLHHHELAQTHCANERPVMLTALYGSQNYGLATNASDVDTKSYVFPSFHEVALHKPLLSNELTALDDSHVELKDYRDMCTNLRKQSINFLETLFTPYVVVNPVFQNFYDSLTSHREEIARIDVNRGVLSMFGHMCNMEKRFKRDGNPKQAATVMRLHDFMRRYTTDEPYEEILFNPSNKDMLSEMRAGKYNNPALTVLVAVEMAAAKEFVNSMPKREVDEKTLEWLDALQIKTMAEGFDVEL